MPRLARYLRNQTAVAFLATAAIATLVGIGAGRPIWDADFIERFIGQPAASVTPLNRPTAEQLALPYEAYSPKFRQIINTNRGGILGQTLDQQEIGGVQVKQ
jgi:hypothetical protein